MGLETATNIKTLVATNPAGGDPRSEGDNHIQMIKSVLQTSFPGLAGALFASVTQTGPAALTLDSIFTEQVSTTPLTLNLPAFASLPSAFLVLVDAKGGAITLDPNAAETINGAASLVVASGDWGILYKGAAEWKFMAAVAGLTAAAIGVTVQAYDVDTAKLDVAQTFTAQQTPKKGSLTDAATIDWDGNVQGQSVKLTTAASRTFNAPSNIVEDNLYVLRLTTGGFIPAWNVAFKWAVAPTALENATYVFTFIGGAGGVLIPTSSGYKTGA